jgi:SAM-dependent methyltransferase
MGWYGDHVLPTLLDRAMDTDDIRRIRARVAAPLAGEVVEIGFGSGHNVPFLPAGVTRLLAVEPSRTAVRRAAGRIAAARVPVVVVGRDAHRLPLPDASVDAALCTWSLCTIADPVAAVAELGRVLRPGGRLQFVEHGLSADARVRRWQARLDPFQRRLVGGCHLDRDVPEILRLGGLAVGRLERYYGPGPRPFTAMYEGTAAAADPAERFGAPAGLGGD